MAAVVGDLVPTGNAATFLTADLGSSADIFASVLFGGVLGRLISLLSDLAATEETVCAAHLRVLCNPTFRHFIAKRTTHMTLRNRRSAL